jgi:hypothetical protein
MEITQQDKQSVFFCWNVGRYIARQVERDKYNRIKKAHTHGGFDSLSSPMPWRIRKGKKKDTDTWHLDANPPLPL